MTISLTPELDQLLNERLASGQYKSVEEVLSRGTSSPQRGRGNGRGCQGRSRRLPGRSLSIARGSRC